MVYKWEIRTCASARMVIGSENPKNSGPEIRVFVFIARQCSVHGFVGEWPVNVRPVCVFVTRKTGPTSLVSIRIS